MTPEEREQLKELLEWKKARETQQLFEPVDDTSKTILRVVSTSGTGSTARTQNISVPATPTSITVPATNIGSLIFETPDGRFEIGYLAAL